LQKTMLKNVDWGGLTIVNLLGVLAFPPYFIYLMTLAALTASGFLWTTHLSEADQLRFLEFEKEFRKGYKLEKVGKLKEAQKWYRKLKKRYANHPQANHLVTLQIEKLAANTGKSQKNSRPKKGLSPRTNRARS
jgi:hypothetical protein